MTDRDVAIIIPALNEEQTIRGVIESTTFFGIVIVVDDGSTDSTATIARDAGAIVISHPHTQGYDCALWTGLSEASKRQCLVAITIDADGQHPARKIPEFLEKIQDGADVVIGIRPKRQRFAESLFSCVSSLLWRVSDPMCGMKAYRTKVLDSLQFRVRYFSIGTEFVISAVRRGFDVRQIPIDVYQRKEVITRFGNGIEANLRILRALFLGLIWAR